jgi:hypothetical protein
LGVVDPALTEQYGVKAGTKLIRYDFVLVSDQEAKQLREHNATQAMQKLGRRMKLWNGLPVCLTPDRRSNVLELIYCIEQVPDVD